LYEAFSNELQDRASALFTNTRVEIWRDTDDIRTGEKWDARIEQALRKSQLLIVMLSPKWLESDYCRKEYSIFQEVEKSLPEAEYVFPLLVYGIEREREFLVGDQPAVFDSVMARQFKKTLARDFLLMAPNQISAQVAALAEEMRDPIDLLRRRPSSRPQRPPCLRRLRPRRRRKSFPTFRASFVTSRKNSSAARTRPSSSTRPGRRRATMNKSARTSSPSSRSVAKGRPRSSPNGRRSWRTRVGRGARRLSPGPFTARGRASRWRRLPICS